MSRYVIQAPSSHAAIRSQALDALTEIRDALLIDGDISALIRSLRTLEAEIVNSKRLSRTTTNDKEH